MTNTNEAFPSESALTAAIEAGEALAKPHKLDETGRFMALPEPHYSTTKVIDLDEMRREFEDKYRDRPLRQVGKPVVFDAASFNTFYAKHGTPETDVWADRESRRIQAVFNPNGGAAGVPGFGDHALTLTLKQTDAWKIWAANDGKLLSQNGFAELVEARLPDITEPASATLLEIAQTFSATGGRTFESSQRLSTGETNLVFREEINAKAGKQGNIEIPQSFSLALVPFEGGDAYKVTARLRFRITEGELRIGYVLDRPVDVLDAAFAGIAETIGKNTEATILYGKLPVSVG